MQGKMVHSLKNNIFLILNSLFAKIYDISLLFMYSSWQYSSNFIK